MVVEHRLNNPEGVLIRPDSPCGTGILVLGGSSGRVDDERARLLAGHGALALSVRWFGGEAQQPAPYEVPLEQLTVLIDALADECDRLAVVGVSFGAELALVLASRDARIAAVVAFAPSSVVWAGVAADGPGGDPRQTSHWSSGSEPLPFVPLSESWEPDTEPPAFRSMYATSLAEGPALAEAAAIPVERISGDVVLVAGGDDQVWPSVDFALSIEARRAGHGLATVVVTHQDAGHRTVLPGESPVVTGMAMQRGGTPEADAELGRWAWPHLSRALHLPDPPA